MYVAIDRKPENECEIHNTADWGQWCDASSEAGEDGWWKRVTIL